MKYVKSKVRVFNVANYEKDSLLTWLARHGNLLLNTLPGPEEVMLQYSTYNNAILKIFSTKN